jgi:hypothetical protein
MQVTSILTPLVRREIPDLLKWISFCPTPFLNQEETKKITWHLSIDDEWKQYEVEDVISYARHSHFKLFDIVFHSLNIDPKESVYLRNIARSDSVDLPYGSKSGPNKQFYESLKVIIDYCKYSSQDALLLLEVDAIPIKQGWLTGLNKSIENHSDFLIAGAKYIGKSKLSPVISQHLNGNAIYGIGSKYFKEALLGWESLLKRIVPECHWIAYDICFEWIKNSKNPDHAKIIDEYAPVLNLYNQSCVDMSDYIANISGALEVSNEYVPLDVLKKSHLILHSKPLSKRIDHLLAGLSLDEDSLAIKDPLNCKLKAFAQGPYAYFSSPNESQLSVEITNKLLNSESFITNRLVCSMVKSCIRKPESTF